VKDKKYPYISIRGLKIESEDPVSKMKFAKIEVAIKEDQEGITSFIQLATEMKSKYYFTYVRLMGDTEENVGTRRVEVKQDGFMKIVEGFTAGLFNFTYEFRVYNF